MYYGEVIRDLDDNDLSPGQTADFRVQVPFTHKP